MTLSASHQKLKNFNQKIVQKVVQKVVKIDHNRHPSFTTAEVQRDSESKTAHDLETNKNSLS